MCVSCISLFVLYLLVFVIFLFLLVSGLAAVCDCDTPFSVNLFFCNNLFLSVDSRKRYNLMDEMI